MQLSDEEYNFLKSEAAEEEKTLQTETENYYQQLQLRQDLIKERVSRLADGYMDGVFDKETYLAKKNALVFEQQSLKEQLAKSGNLNGQILTRFELFLELANSAYLSYKAARPEDKRDLVETLTSNFTGKGKLVLITLEKPFQMMAERPCFTSGSPYREAARTLRELFKNLLAYFRTLDIAKSLDDSTNFITSKDEKNKRYNFLKLRN